jgi:hypothetical protein
MAKFGEGDPRWIVTERQDGTNINGWHWEVRLARANANANVLTESSQNE